MPFVNVVFNRSGQSGTVRIWAIDDSGWRAGPVILTPAPNESVAGVRLRGYRGRLATRPEAYPAQQGLPFRATGA